MAAGEDDPLMEGERVGGSCAVGIRTDHLSVTALRGCLLLVVAS